MSEELWAEFVRFRTRPRQRRNPDTPTLRPGASRARILRGPGRHSLKGCPDERSAVHNRWGSSLADAGPASVPLAAHVLRRHLCAPWASEAVDKTNDHFCHSKWPCARDNTHPSKDHWQRRRQRLQDCQGVHRRVDGAPDGQRRNDEQEAPGGRGRKLFEVEQFDEVNAEVTQEFNVHGYSGIPVFGG